MLLLSRKNAFKKQCKQEKKLTFDVYIDFIIIDFSHLLKEKNSFQEIQILNVGKTWC